MACVTRFVVDEPHPGARLERVELHDAASGVDGAENRADPGDVVRRHADQRGFVRLRAEELHGADDVRRELTLAQDRGLRRAGRAAGEQQCGDVLRGRDPGGRAAPRRRRTSLRNCSRVRYRESVGERHGQRRIRRGDQDTWPEPLEHGVQLIGGEPVADRHECLSGQRRAEQQQRDSRRVAVQQPGPLAGLRRQPLPRVPGEAQQFARSWRRLSAGRAQLARPRRPRPSPAAGRCSCAVSPRPAAAWAS